MNEFSPTVVASIVIICQNTSVLATQCAQFVSAATPVPTSSPGDLVTTNSASTAFVVISKAQSAA